MQSSAEKVSLDVFVHQNFAFLQSISLIKYFSAGLFWLAIFFLNVFALVVYLTLFQYVAVYLHSHIAL